MILFIVRIFIIVVRLVFFENCMVEKEVDLVVFCMFYVVFLESI